MSASRLVLLSLLAVDIITLQSLRDYVRLQLSAAPQAHIVVSMAPPAQHTLLELRYRRTARQPRDRLPNVDGVPNRESGP